MKTIFTLEYVINYSYEGGIKTYNIASSFDKNKLKDIQDKIEKEMIPIGIELTKTEQKISNIEASIENISLIVNENEVDTSKRIKEASGAMRIKERKKQLSIIFDNYPTIKEYFYDLITFQVRDDASFVIKEYKFI